MPGGQKEMGKVGDPDLGLGCSAGQGCSAYQLTQVQTFTAPAQRRELILAAAGVGTHSMLPVCPSWDLRAEGRTAVLSTSLLMELVAPVSHLTLWSPD